MYNKSMLRHRFSNERWGGGGGGLNHLPLLFCKSVYTQGHSVLIYVNPILDGGGANLPPPAGFLNIAQKPLGLGS